MTDAYIDITGGNCTYNTKCGYLYHDIDYDKLWLDWSTGAYDYDGFWYTNTKVDILRVCGRNNGTKSCGYSSFAINNIATDDYYYIGA